MEHDPFDIVGLEELEAEKERKRKLFSKQKDSDFIWLMSNKRGRRIMAGLLETAGINRSSFNDKALVMAFLEGHRNYGNMILERLQAVSFEMYLQMLKEHRNARQSFNSKSSKQ